MWHSPITRGEKPRKRGVDSLLFAASRWHRRSTFWRRGLLALLTSVLLVGGVLSTAPVAQAAPTAPGAPTSLVGTSGNGRVSLTWVAPGSNGGSAITGYTVTASPGGATATSKTLAATVTGLTNGTAYTFTVTATNAIGTSPPSAVSNTVTPATVPGVPTKAVASLVGAQVVVSWTAPASNGGSPITGYTVTSTPDGVTATTTGALSVQVNGLTNGHHLHVHGDRDQRGGHQRFIGCVERGDRRRSVTAPGAPTSLVGTSGNGQATVTWTAPASNGGSAITGYTVTASPGGATATSPALPPPPSPG